MKKAVIVTLLFSLMTFFSACSSDADETSGIYGKIHELYYDINSYTAECVVTSFTTGGENSYEMKIVYDKSKQSHKVTSDDMTVEIYNDKTIVSKGDAVIETDSEPTDMPVFPEIFFKSYYQSENTSLSVAAESDSGSVLLECETVNSTKVNSHMKLWIDKKTVKPQKMQIYDDKGNMHTQIDFKSFDFDV